PVKMGAPPVYQDVVAAGELAAHALEDGGYPYADVELVQDRQDREVFIRYDAQPGPAAYFGPIEISGNASVDDNVIRRTLTFRPGERYSRQRVMESQRMLYGMDL